MNIKKYTKIIGLISGLLVSLFVIIFIDIKPGEPQITYTLAIALLMAIWWITEAIPIAATSLLPVALFPLLGVMNGKIVSSAYFNHVIFLFIGGFLMSLAMEKWNLHKRIALRILLIIGVSPGRILLGFILSTAFLSMWMSNTATAMMMVPIVLSIIVKLEEVLDKKDIKKYSKGLLLGIAYSASIGGIATLIGTPPNISFSRIYAITFPEVPEISFATWFIFALPLSIILLAFLWGYLYFIFRPKKKWNKSYITTFKQEYTNLGKTSYEESIVFILFISLALLWIFRKNIDIGWFSIPGWSSIFKNPEILNDGTVAIFIALILFIIPSKNKTQERIMDWKTAKKIPWNIVLLFGGGFALASGFVESGLSIWIGEQLKWFTKIHPIILIFCIALIMSFLTELTSNTATTEMLLPILAGIAISSNINPLLLMIPATLSASLAFMLPIATPPNAIVFGTNRLKMIDLIKTGFILNFVGILLVTLFMYFVGTFIFKI